MVSQIRVRKRSGELEALDLEKLHKVVSWACEGLTGISASEIELRAHLLFTDGMKTSDIQETLIKSAGELISEDAPNYQIAAGRLVSYHLRKTVYGSYTVPRLYEHVLNTVEAGFYDPMLTSVYSEAEWDELDKHIKHDRDNSLTYGAMELWRDKYLVRNRATGEIFETPQVAYMLIAAFLFHRYGVLKSPEERMKYVKSYYDAISEHYISLPTPIMAGVRTPQRQFASCVLIESDDSLDSIFATTTAIGKYVSQKAGIGIGGGKLRPIGSAVRNGDATTTGVIPYYRLWQSATKSASQGGVRGGSSTLYCPIWHMEIEDILVLKNNKGTDENRLREMDYGIQFNRLMYQRLLSGGDITLFNQKDVPGLYEAFFNDQDKFTELYEKAERNTRLRKKKIPALELFSIFVQERKDTGRIYLMNVDNVNTQGSFIADIAPVHMSNLCVAGDTLISIKTSDGMLGEVLIKDLGEILRVHGDDVEVWSYDEVKEDTCWAPITAWALMNPEAETLKITDMNTGYSIECTADHQIYTKNRGWVKAGELNEDDQLLLDAIQERQMLKIEKLTTKTPVYDITVAGVHNFFGNGILVHNCAEVTLPTRPLDDIKDEQGEIATCILSATNWGLVKDKHEFKWIADLTVRALDELITIQSYPVRAAEIATKARRPLGVGIINFAYWLAKNDLNYQDIDKEGLELVDEYAEAWSYYLIKASADLAAESYPCDWYQDTKYSKAQLPNDTYKMSVDDLVGYKSRMPWGELKMQLLHTGIRNSTLMALMPAETSAIASNSTNGIEPPRGLVSIKQSKDGVIKQIVPEVRRLKNKYDLLWDQKSPLGYLKIMAVLQKYVDQAISVNTTYNPAFYPDGDIPQSVLLEHILLFYKWGGKNLYYMNIADGAGELDIDQKTAYNQQLEDDCDSCRI